MSSPFFLDAFHLCRLRLDLRFCHFRRSDLHPARLDGKDPANDRRPHILEQLLEQFRCAALILYQRVALSGSDAYEATTDRG